MASRQPLSLQPQFSDLSSGSEGSGTGPMGPLQPKPKACLLGEEDLGDHTEVRSV